MWGRWDSGVSFSIDIVALTVREDLNSVAGGFGERDILGVK